MQTMFERRGGDCVISVSGRITIDSSPDLLVFLSRPLKESDCESLTVDLYNVSYVDTSGLAVLLEALKIARRQEKAFQLRGLRDRPRYVLEATRLLHLFHEVERV